MSGAPRRTLLPLIRAREGDVFAHTDKRTVRVEDYLREVASLAARLPARSHVVNLCQDRYRFTVAFGAALSRGQVSLLPPQRTPDFLSRLAQSFAGLYAVTDQPEDSAPLELIVHEEGAVGPRTASMPTIAAGEVAAIAFTSGTTGEPTPHVKRWGALAHGAVGEAAALGLDRVPGAALVGTVPPQHMYGFESTVLLALQAGVTMFSGRPFYPLDIHAALESVPAPRALITTPVHLRALALENMRLPPLNLIVSATAPLSIEAAQAAEARHEAPVYEIYGFTEAGMVACRRTAAGPTWRTLPGVRIRHDGDRWWAEGGHVPMPAPFTDLIDVLDVEHFSLRGRASDVVNVAGKRASLAALNAHLLAIPGVIDGVYYIPEERGDTVTRLGAFVVAPTLTSKRLRAELRRRIDAVFLPRPLHFVSELPRNATGKVTHEALRHFAAARRGE
jgi:acyl-coenzyme A synthetase/AMP-(fatty) acid ligase